MPEPLVTVVVLNWNGRRLLPGCLDALAKQDLDPARWQLQVVDNGSVDGSLELLARDYPQVQVIENGANLGFSGGNNTALRQVTTPFVALLNNDAFPEPDWLRQLLAAAQAPDAEVTAAITSKVLFEPRFVRLELETPEYRAAADPRPLGARITRVELDGTDITGEVLWDHGAYGVEQVGRVRYRWTQPRGRVLVPLPRSHEQVTPHDLRLTVTASAERAKALTLRWADGEASLPLDETPSEHALTITAGTPLVDVINNVGSILLAPAYGADRGYQEVDAGQYDTAEDVFLMCCAAVCLRTEALQQVGVLDDDFFMYYEDTDLSWRLQAAGWRIRYAPQPVVRHLHSASSGEWSPFFTFHVERNRLLLLAKDAPASLAMRQALRFNVTTLSMLRRALLQAARDRRRPGLRSLLLRARVMASYLRLLPRMLARRRTVSRLYRAGNTTRQALLDRWLQASR